MTWNLLGYGASVTSDRKDAYKQILNHVEPDIVVAQEVENTASASDFLTSVLNAADGPGGYAMADFVDYVPDSDCALYYKTDKITYNAGVDFAVLPTALRNIMRWKVGHVGAGVEGDLYVYGAHLKAGAGQANVDLRDAEAAIMRADADALPAGTQFVYSGDFNLQNANINDVPFANPPETAWATLTDVGGDPDGQSFDPINAPGLWTGRIVFAGIHTQSPHEDNADAPPGAAAGGMDDRFDFILISDALQDGVDLSVINGSYEAFGNDGNHFNADINDGPVIPQGQAIADALHEASDHLPVIMELGLFMAP
jgi:endonuclease/exonuclease/phosphatase family metal-dependent hydrolase